MKNNSIPLIMSRVFNVPLMIHEPKLDVILWALKDRLGITIEEPSDAPEKYSESLEAKTAVRQPGAAVVPAVAIIPVHDSLVHRHSMMQSHSGMTSYLYVRNIFRKALASDEITAIILHIDSPGGEVAGCRELAEEIFAARGSKPIYAAVDEHAFSAAYYLASATDQIFVPKSGGVGSIGVIAKHFDQSKYNEKEGVVVTTIYAGARKNDLSPHEPLSDEAYAAVKEIVDGAHELFTGDVARYRGATKQHIKGMESALYWGEKAIEAGLADQIGSLDDAIAAALSASRPGARSISTRGILPGKENTMERFETLAALADEYPEFAEQLRAEGKNSVDVTGAVNEAVTAAITGKTENILALAEIHFGADEAGKFKTVIESGISAEQYRAVVPEGSTPAASPESKKMDEMLQVITDQTGKQSPGMGGGQDINAMPDGLDKWTAEYERSADLQGEFRNAEVYAAYKKANSEGRVKILGERKVQ